MLHKQTEEEAKRRELGLRQTQNLNLPAPRLQLTWLQTAQDWLECECIYSLVLPLKDLDIRAEGEGGARVRNEHHSIISWTKRNGGVPGRSYRPVFNDGVVMTPFRDGAHSGWDAEALKLPVYAVCEDKWTKLKEKEAKQTQTKA
jgi:hypothetical protein